MDIRKFFGKKPAAGDAGTGAAAGGAADKPKASAEDDKKKASSSKGTDKKVAASPAAKTASKKSTAASAGEHCHCLVLRELSCLWKSMPTLQCFISQAPRLRHHQNPRTARGGSTVAEIDKP